MTFTETFANLQKGKLPDYLGLTVNLDDPEVVTGRFDVAERHMAPNGYLHAASIIALLDTACGYGCMSRLPKGASGFTTVELKTNHVGTAREGTVVCEARMTHGGRTTQVWDAVARREGDGAAIAYFRCTQLILYPKP